MLLNILIFVAVLGLLIFVHEFGHFITAKLAGITVEEFGFGYPPRLAGIKFKGTLYSLNWLPFGGFVKLKGMFSSAKEPHSFDQASVWVRMLVIVSGVLMNLVLAWLLLWMAFLIGFTPFTQPVDQYSGAKVLKTEIIITGVLDNSPAQQSGLQPGDIVIEALGEQFTYTENFQKFTRAHRGQSVDMLIDRQGERQSFKVQLNDTDSAPLGVAVASNSVIKLPFWQALKAASLELYGLTKAIFSAFVSLIQNLFAQGQVPAGVVGPVGIYHATATAAAMGWVALLSLVIILSINFALLNIMPFPALDGGHFLFLLTEVIFGRKVIKAQLEAVITTFGFILLIALILLLTYRDIITFG